MQQSSAPAMDRAMPRMASDVGVAVNLNAPQVTDRSGVSIFLGEAITTTASGTTYRVAGDGRIAAKIYHAGPSRHLTGRLEAMLDVQGDELRKVTAWPTSLLYPKGRDEPVGFLMPLPVARSPIHSLYSPKAASLQFKNPDWRFAIRVGINTARAFAAIHKADCLVGSILPENIYVGQDGTVRLTECDSFQIAFDTHLASDLSLEAFTPPELQGKPFSGLVRSVNHDNFGLAVLIFLLLFKRHPFAGRYLGAGDMPISTAISEFRFAYGSRRNANMMEAPPGSPALSIVGPELTSLFERAFGKAAAKGSRPSPREWMAALGRLEQDLKGCQADSSHWHHAAVSCPWCRRETGMSRAGTFYAEDLSPEGGRGFEALWREVEALDAPGEAPNVVLNDTTPSDSALAIKRKGNFGHLAGFVIAITLMTVGILSKIEAIHPLWFIGAGILAFFIMHGLFNTASDEAALKRRLERAKFRWEAAQAEWMLRAGSEEFTRQKARLDEIRAAWDQLPALSRRKHEELKENHWALQRNRYLDGYLIAEARIEAVTPERRTFLASYGIETAADIDIKRFNGVPGLSGRILESLLAWRTSIERDFVFNPNIPVDPADISKIERELHLERRRLTTQLTRSIASLRQVRNDIEAARRSLKEPTEKAYRNYAQAQVDAAVLA